MLINLLGTNFKEILIKIHFSSFTKMHLKLTSARIGGNFPLTPILSPPPNPRPEEGGGGGGGGGGGR